MIKHSALGALLQLLFQGQITLSRRTTKDSENHDVSSSVTSQDVTPSDQAKESGGQATSAPRIVRWETEGSDDLFLQFKHFLTGTQMTLTILRIGHSPQRSGLRS